MTLFVLQLKGVIEMEYREFYVARKADAVAVELVRERGWRKVGVVLSGFFPAVRNLEREGLIVYLSGVFPRGALLSASPLYCLWQGEPVDGIVTDGTALVEQGEWQDWLGNLEIIVVGDAHTPSVVRGQVGMLAEFDDGSWVGTVERERGD